MGELEKNIIIDYPLLATKACMEKYGISNGKVRWFCEKHKLLVNKSTKSLISKTNTTNYWKNHTHTYNVNEEFFINKITKESAYLLGFIWGDGYLTTKQIRIECVSDDINKLRRIFEKTGKWCFNTRIRENKKREVTTVSTTNKKLINFLYENDYTNKSTKTPNKIFNHLPNKMKKYFILGWIDADGCFYYNKKNNCRQFSIAGSYEQDWGIFEYLLRNLSIKFGISRRSNKNQSSLLRITNKTGIKLLGEYIYDDLIPLKRKYNKYIEIIE